MNHFIVIKSAPKAKWVKLAQSCHGTIAYRLRMRLKSIIRPSEVDYIKKKKRD